MIDSGRERERGVGSGVGEHLTKLLQKIDWKTFFGLTRSWPGQLNKENKQDPSIQGLHSYAKPSVAEPLRQQFHHTNITCGQCCVTISMTTGLPSGTAHLTGRQRITRGWGYGFVERNNTI